MVYRLDGLIWIKVVLIMRVMDFKLVQGHRGDLLIVNHRSPWSWREPHPVKLALWLPCSSEHSG